MQKRINVLFAVLKLAIAKPALKMVNASLANMDLLM